MNGLLRSLNALLGNSGIRWAVCGGFALDLFLNRETRAHGDLDIAVSEGERGRIEPFMRARGWQVYEFRGQGRLRPLEGEANSEPGRNLMCVREGCELVTFWPCDEPGLVLHEWHATGIKALNYMEFLFHEEREGAYLLDDGQCRPLDKAYGSRDGIPYLAPELVLLYKAFQPERETNRRDYEAVFPELSEESRQWLAQALPPDHPWTGGGRYG